MTDRDKFAAAALTGWLASQQTVLSARAMASHAYEYADAMLAARGDKPAAQEAAAPGDAGEDVPGRGFRWGKPGEALQDGDEVKQVRMSGTRWLACARVGRVIREGESFIWRRRITTADDAAPEATAIRDAALALYEVGQWVSPDVPAAQADAMWATLRDALGLPVGHATARGVAAAPPAAGVTLTAVAVPLDSDILEAVAKVVYEAMLFDSGPLHCRPAPPWVHGGNSLAQDEARDAARNILAMVPPAAGPTLTDAEREAVARLCNTVEEYTGMGIHEDGFGVDWKGDLAAVDVGRGLLARAAKEPAR